MSAKTTFVAANGTLVVNSDEKVNSKAWGDFTGGGEIFAKIPGDYPDIFHGDPGFLEKLAAEKTVQLAAYDVPSFELKDGIERLVRSAKEIRQLRRIVMSMDPSSALPDRVCATAGSDGADAVKKVRTNEKA